MLPPIDLLEDPSYIESINEVHELMFPGMGQNDFQQDATSLALDPQERYMDPVYLQAPVVDPVSRTPEALVYKSKLKTYATERRIETVPEMLSALDARNFNPTNITEPQPLSIKVDEVWDHFIKTACVSNAKEKLAEYRANPVGLEREIIAEWAGKQDAGKLKKLMQSIERDGRALEEIPLHEYGMMLKADAKPPMSDKPLRQQVAPQTISFQDKHASACFSAVLRVLARRLLALLKPNFRFSMLKDNKDTAAFLATWYPWDDDTGVKYVENDITKYDKSQDEMCTMLKLKMLDMMGMSPEMLARWEISQGEAYIRSMTLGISIVIINQQKSGDGGGR